jgi:hypothetical protein
MNHTIVNKALAVILFIAAYYIFDWYDWTQMGIASVLFLSGVNSFFRDSESVARRNFGHACLRTAAVIAVFLIVKILIFG